MLKNRYNFKHWYKRLAVFLLDMAGGFVFPRRNSPLKTETLQRVLFIRFDQIGDIAMLAPAVRAFKARFPGAALDLLTSPEGALLFEKEDFFQNIHIFKSNWFCTAPFAGRNSGGTILNSTLCYLNGIKYCVPRLRKSKYDAAVDFRGDLRTITLMKMARIPERIGYPRTGGHFMLTRVGRFEQGLHQVKLNLVLLSCFGIPGSAEVISAPFRATEEEKKNFWEGAGRGILLQTLPIIVVHPGAGRSEKVWETAKFRRLVERMIKDKLGQVVLIGTDSEKKAFGEIKHEHVHLTDLRGKTSLRDLLVLFSAADIFIGNDSGPAHLAAAQGARVVSIFKGPNDPKVWHPWARKLYLIRDPEPISARRVYEAVLEAWRDNLLG